MPAMKTIEPTAAAPVWILGARDPEMLLIHALLQATGQTSQRLTVRGKSCYPGNAYRGDPPRVSPGMPLVRVECAWPGAGSARVVDHHRPGDPGYGVPAERFMLAASVGQVITLLARLDQLRALRDRWDFYPRAAGAGRAVTGHIGFYRSAWWVADAAGDYRLPDEVVYVAAGDHCLGDAYRGGCPGVAPEALYHFRVARDAAYRKVSAATIYRDLETAIAALEEAPRLSLAPGITVADMRGQSLPELNEAAAYRGLAYVAELPDRSRRRKVVLRVATPAIMAAWPRWARAQGLKDLYGGDPARGFAGGYR